MDHQLIISVILGVCLSQALAQQTPTTEAELNRLCTNGLGQNLDNVNKVHPDFCERFIQCVGGKAYPVRCWPGLQYNPAKDTCDWATNVRCTSRLGEPSRSKCYYSKCRFFQGMCVEDSSKTDGYFCRCLQGYSGPYCQYRTGTRINVGTVAPVSVAPGK